MSHFFIECLHMIMTNVFRPFEDMASYVTDEIKASASQGLKRLLALEHPYPMLKH